MEEVPNTIILNFNGKKFYHSCKMNHCPNEHQHIQLIFNTDELPPYLNSIYNYKDENELFCLILDYYSTEMQEYICNHLNNNPKIDITHYELFKNYNNLNELD